MMDKVHKVYLYENDISKKILIELPFVPFEGLRLEGLPDIPIRYYYDVLGVSYACYSDYFFCAVKKGEHDGDPTTPR